MKLDDKKVSNTKTALKTFDRYPINQSEQHWESLTTQHMESKMLSRLARNDYVHFSPMNYTRNRGMEYYNNIKREKEEIGEEVKKAENLEPQRLTEVNVET